MCVFFLISNNMFWEKISDYIRFSWWAVEDWKPILFTNVFQKLDLKENSGIVLIQDLKHVVYIVSVTIYFLVFIKNLPTLEFGIKKIVSFT